MKEIFIIKDYETNQTVEIFLCEDASKMHQALRDAEIEGGSVYENFLEILSERGIKYEYPKNVDTFIY